MNYFIVILCSRYFVGIIDFLSRFKTWKKKSIKQVLLLLKLSLFSSAAHFFKSFLWTDEELSTVPAHYYAK